MKLFFHSLLLACVFLAGCQRQDNELLDGGVYTLSSQAAVNAFSVTEDIHTLTISGTDITDLSALPMKRVKNLIIENTGLIQLRMPQLNAVTQSFIIRDNDRLEEINGLDQFLFHSGPLMIQNNKVLHNISGLLGLKILKGDLTVSGNDSLGENQPCVSDTIGFCVVKTLMNNGILNGLVTLTNNHPHAPTDPIMIGQVAGSDIISYVIASKADADNFKPLSDSAMDLRIAGAEITDAVMASIASKLVAVKGTVTVENTSITTSEGFFDRVNCLGSIVLRNNAELMNPQGFKGYTYINGDLIIRDCPKMYYWGFPTGQASFSGITRIEGSLIINPAPALGDGGAGFGSLKYIGGDFEITGDRTKGEIWNLDTWTAVGGGLEHVGGNFTFRNHYKVNGLHGFQNINHIGGDITIVDNGGPDGVIPNISTAGQIGFCIVKEWINNGIVKKADAVIELRARPNESNLDVTNLPTCN
jgi:hypothetical protein